MKFRIKPKHLGFNRSLLDRTTWFIKNYLKSTKKPDIFEQTKWNELIVNSIFGGESRVISA